MTEITNNVTDIKLDQEMKKSYLDYAMSVIVGRALPDARDGLKPVHRRVLFAMRDLGNDHSKPYKKSARIVGDVIGKYHPHGDSAVYDAIVRMAQPFSMRHMLIDGQGNFGSIDGDAPAAMRYTEVRMAKLASELLMDLEKETVQFAPNYDESEFEPTVLPTRVPNLLVNGSSGIAVGMATNIPPHNLSEVINGIIAVIDNSEITIDELIENFIPGPDFPTSGIMFASQGIQDAYKTGKGSIKLRGKTHIEYNDNSRDVITISELPFQVNKARLIEKIADLVRSKSIEGIAELRDESDKDGLRVVIEIKKGENAEVIRNLLFKHTPLETSFGINFVALVNNQPRLLNLRQLLDIFIDHRKEIVTRRSIFDLRKARKRAHVLEGLLIALHNIDEIIETIKGSKNPAEAKDKLTSIIWKASNIEQKLKAVTDELSRPEFLSTKYGLKDGNYLLSPEQAQAILELRLHRLTALEQDKIIDEYNALIEQIKYFLSILNDEQKLIAVIKDELIEVKNNYGEERRTSIEIDTSSITTEDLIPKEDLLVTMSSTGYIKTQSLDNYRQQHRGGRGKTAAKVKEDDFITNAFVANSHETLLCFTSLGKVFWLKVYQLPKVSTTSKGKPIVNLLPLGDGEKIQSILPVNEFNNDKFIFFATQNGTVKKTSLEQYSRPRANGIIAIDIKDNDELISTEITDGNNEIMLFTQSGKSIKFDENKVRSVGRSASGVKGINLAENDKVISMIIPKDDANVLIATENGFGKQTPVNLFSLQGRAGKGVIAINTSERNGCAVSALMVQETDEVMLITTQGTLVRISVDEIAQSGRNTQGVTLIKPDENDKLSKMLKIIFTEDEMNDD
ncbi:MAG: DNA gyrase subunit A [Gammaproteobacteria bacterium]